MSSGRRSQSTAAMRPTCLPQRMPPHTRRRPPRPRSRMLHLPLLTAEKQKSTRTTSVQSLPPTRSHTLAQSFSRGRPHLPSLLAPPPPRHTHTHTHLHIHTSGRRSRTLKRGCKGACLVLPLFPLSFSFFFFLFFLLFFPLVEGSDTLCKGAAQIRSRKT